MSEYKEIAIYHCIHCDVILRGEVRSMPTKIRIHGKANHPGVKMSPKHDIVSGSRESALALAGSVQVVGGKPTLKITSHHIRYGAFTKDGLRGVSNKKTKFSAIGLDGLVSGIITAETSLSPPASAGESKVVAV